MGCMLFKVRGDLFNNDWFVSMLYNGGGLFNEGAVMSGGAFDHQQYTIQHIAEDIDTRIRNNNYKNEYGYANNYSDKTLLRFKEAIVQLKKAHIYAQRVDWLLSGDDGEDTFHERLDEELAQCLTNS